jgi:hypothetical protein
MRNNMLLATFTSTKRCFWGTDASAMLERTSCSYSDCVKLFTEHMDFLSASDKEWIMGCGLAKCLDCSFGPPVLFYFPNGIERSRLLPALTKGSRIPVSGDRPHHSVLGLKEK